MKIKIILISLFIIFISINIVSANDLNTTTDLKETGDNDIITTITGNDLVKYYKNDSQFEVNVYGENESKLENGFVDFTINGNTYKRIVSNGTAKLNVNLNPGVYQITSKNCYDNTTIKNKITVLSTISSSDLTKYYRNESQFYTTILDNQGNPKANANIKININTLVWSLFFKRKIICL